MKMKFKMMAVACLTLCASSVYAATGGALACDTTSAVNMVNTCAPEVKLYIAGPFIPGNQNGMIPMLGLFDPAKSIIVITDNSSSMVGLYGMSKATLTGGTSKRLYLGVSLGTSGNTVSLLLSKTGSVVEGNVAFVGPLSKIAANTCAATSSALVVKCTNVAPATFDLVISDVHPAELYKLHPSATAKLSTLTSTPLLMEGYGIAVSADLYQAMQAANIREGLLPSACVAGDQTAACQPTIRRADYASLVTQVGTIKSAAALLGDPLDNNQLTLGRLVDTSGTQAATNIFFANTPCGGMGYDSKLGFNFNPVTGKNDKLNLAALGGGLSVISSADFYPGLTIQNYSKLADLLSALTVKATPAVLDPITGAVITPAVPTSYVIGLMPLRVLQGGAGSWQFVKINGISPTFNVDGTPDQLQRSAFTNGNYPFFTTVFAVKPAKPVAASVGKLYPQLVDALVSSFKDSTTNNQVGVGYLDGAADVAGIPKQANYRRMADNNCSPLIKTTPAVAANVVIAPASVTAQPVVPIVQATAPVITTTTAVNATTTPINATITPIDATITLPSTANITGTPVGLTATLFNISGTMTSTASVAPVFPTAQGGTLVISSILQPGVTVTLQPDGTVTLQPATVSGVLATPVVVPVP